MKKSVAGWTKLCPREVHKEHLRYMPDEYDRCDVCLLNDYNLWESIYPHYEKDYLGLAEGGYSRDDVLTAIRKAELRVPRKSTIH